MNLPVLLVNAVPSFTTDHVAVADLFDEDGSALIITP